MNRQFPRIPTACAEGFKGRYVRQQPSNSITGISDAVIFDNTLDGCNC